MTRKLTPQLSEGAELVVASHNPGKVREINDLIKPFGFAAISVGELGLPEPVEDGDTFGANAEIKALAAATASGRPALADDSGLCVSALDDAPGIYSARWAGDAKDFTIAMDKVETALKDTVIRGEVNDAAHFMCALCLAWPDGHTETFEGRVDGRLTFPPRGDQGFGYDPIFIADGESITFGEMDPDKKHGMSHRARAFAKLVKAVFEA